MIATKTRRKPARKIKLPARPVSEVLLDLAYHLHTTRVIARPTKNR